MNTPNTPHPDTAATLDERFAVLRFAGTDAVAFLHGQLSCQVSGLAVPGATFGSYNTAKGRMLASFLLVRSADALDMVLARDLAAAIEKRLKMFVLRAKVTIGLREDVCVIGLAGDACKRAEALLGQPWPSAAWSVATAAGGLWTCLPDARVLAITDAAWWRANQAAVAGTAARDAAAWARLDIAAGLPWITPATQDQLVAQMANLELIGGVNFQKGCYPGQEIIARTQHLGKVKRRMYRGHVDAQAAAGDAVYGTDVGDQASGLIVNAAPSPRGGSDVLAVMHSTTAAAGAGRLGSIGGPAIGIESLPYALD